MCQEFQCVMLEQKPPAAVNGLSRVGRSRGPPHLQQMTYALSSNHGIAKGAAVHHEPIRDHPRGYHAVWRSCLCIVTRASLQLTHTRIFLQLPQAAALANI